MAGFMKIVDKTSEVLAVVGGINWVTVGFFSTDLVSKILGVVKLDSIAGVVEGIAGIAIVYVAGKALLK